MLVFIVLILFVILEALSVVYSKKIFNIRSFRYFVVLGIFVHEFSHYIACKLTGASVKEFRVGIKSGHVIHGKSKIPVLGDVLISIAPLIIGTWLLWLLFLWITKSTSDDLSVFTQIQLHDSIFVIVDNILFFLKKIDFVSWQFVVYVFLTLNILAAFTPSSQDYKNITASVVIYSAISIIFHLNQINILLIYILVFAIAILTGALLIVELLLQIKKIIVSFLKIIKLA